MPQKILIFPKNFSNSREYGYCKTSEVKKKNNVINFSKTWHTYVPRGALSMDGINFWG